ncbi:laccase-11-like isoform X2 [Branchiostoma floridae]|uniref:ferroxidase n=1 Tax=Branchiostoma floridae TaxID=7739 RepID=A0A9J7HQN3_BRAFL|nr:laccase-11-like isoform X2 [Branchiostoma floridae]
MTPVSSSTVPSGSTETSQCTSSACRSASSGPLITSPSHCRSLGTSGRNISSISTSLGLIKTQARGHPSMVIGLFCRRHPHRSPATRVWCHVPTSFAAGRSIVTVAITWPSPLATWCRWSSTTWAQEQVLPVQPVHIHGHHFYVLDMGFPEYNSSDGRYSSQNPDIDCGTSERCNAKRWADQSWEGGNKPGLNLRDPPMKDTVIVPVGGYVVIRFTADNPGWWFVHCHIEIHKVEGMAMMIREGTQGQMNPPPPGFPTCREFHWSSAEFERAKKGYSTSWTHTLSVAAGGGIGAAVGFIVGLAVGIICTVLRM